MTVAELRTELDALEAKGAISSDTRVLVSDDRSRDEGCDPIECFEMVASGPGEYEEKRISPVKYAELKSADGDVAVTTSDMFATPRLEMVSGFHFAGESKRSACLVLMNRASPF